MINHIDDLIASNISIKDNKLFFADVDTTELVKKYGTPLYVIDENRVRYNAQRYYKAVENTFKGFGKVLYASKALSFTYLYRVIESEKLCIDVVSSGEIRTALNAGFNLANAYFHSNNKTDEDISYAIDNGVGCFVVDNSEELIAINDIAKSKNIIQKVLLRITPGIDPHTFDAVSTGKVDSKFGQAIETNQAEEITKLAISLSNISLQGFHCHIGSQVFDCSVYIDAIKIMFKFISDMKDKLGFITKVLNLGGGFGVRYLVSQPVVDIPKEISNIGKAVFEEVDRYSLDMPNILFEPGRSIVADSGMTLYTVGTVKKIPEYKNYVSIDGGMTDNPRFALYKAPYTLLPANKMENKRNMKCSVVGRCCESGDIIQENVLMPEDITRGDIVACLTTGAYNYSMASNYNRLPRPPIVVIKDKESFVAVRRETIDDIILLDK